MFKRILFIGGEQSGVYNNVRETRDKIELSVYPKIDFKNLFGIVTLDTRPLRTEVYHKKRFGDVECFCLEGLTNDEILAKIPKKK